MKHLIFYNDTIQAYSMGMTLAGLRVAEYQTAYQLVEVSNPYEIMKYLEQLTEEDIAHLEDIHILNIKPAVGKTQDKLEAELQEFAEYPERAVFWVSNYGQLTEQGNIIFVEGNDNQHILDVYVSAIVNQSSYLNVSNLSSNAQTYFWALRGYLTKTYNSKVTNEAQAQIAYLQYRLLGLSAMIGYVNQASLEETYRMYRAVIDRYQQQTSQYISKKAHSAGAIVKGISINVLTADLYKNEIAEKVSNHSLPTIVLVLEVRPGQTQVTIRTEDVDARKVVSWLGEEPKGTFNASTVFIDAELTPTVTLDGLKHVIESQGM